MNKSMTLPVNVERNRILAALVVLKNIIKRNVYIYYCYIELREKYTEETEKQKIVSQFV